MHYALKLTSMASLKTILTGLFVAVISASALADEPFNGLLLDQDLKPKKGVKIYAKNPKRYTRSDKQGRFGLTDIEPNDTLTLEISKKEKVRIPVEGRKGIRIVLAGDKNANATNDEEIANIGYGYVKRREYSGVSSGISGDRLRSTGKLDIIDALKGMVPGLIITGSNGDYSVCIRGKHTMNMSDEPLYLVNGVVVNTLTNISMFDVEHVEVLKEATQYGSRGAGGAILVTTKSAASQNGKKK